MSAVAHHTSSRWLPVAPLVEALRHDSARRSMATVVERAPVDRRTLERLRKKDRIRLDTADRIAVALGRHPSEIWPDWFEVA
jgi:lambda repressor-like predicted transcriptional regulator